MNKELLTKIAEINSKNMKELTTVELKTIEELSELIQAICKGDIDHIKEEVADCRIMLSQYMLYLKDDKTIAEWEDKKLERQKNRFNI